MKTIALLRSLFLVLLFGSFSAYSQNTVAPAITSANNASFQTGSSGTFTVTATGRPRPTLSENGTLPRGLSFSASSGALRGTPASGTGGTYPLTFTAQNGVAPNAVQAFTLTVNQAPRITSASSATFAVGSAGAFTVTASGWPAPTLSESGALPLGVMFTPSTGTLSGTPQAGSLGSYRVTLTAQNGVTPNATQTFTLTVDQPPAITSANNTTFTVGSLGTFTVTATGTPQPTFSESGALPSGVSFRSSRGTLSGRPASGTAATYPITFTAQNGIMPNAVQSFTLTVNPQPGVPVIQNAGSANGTVGVAFLYQVMATNSPTLYAATGLPTGLSINTSSGLISGTPTTPGLSNVTLEATNGTGTGTAQLAVTIAAAPTIPAVTINQAATQADPTNGSIINFTAVFSTAVTGFSNAGVILGGTAAATAAAVTGSGTTYNVAVSGMTQTGTVTASVAAGAASANGNLNTASTSTDNTVTYDITPPTVTINQAASQADPAGTPPLNFTAVFSEPVTGFITSGVLLGGTAGATNAVVTGSGTTYNVAVGGMTQSGTVMASVAAGAAKDLAGNLSVASTSTDNTVTYNFSPVTVTIDQAASQADPTSNSTINFTAVFSAPVTGFSGSGVVLGGTAGATAAVVSGSGTTYNVAVGGMTQSGTVTASVAAGAASASGSPNAPSTSTDNTVTYNFTTLATPTLIQHVSTTANYDDPGNPYYISLPNLTGGGNTLVVGVSYPFAAGRTAMVSDDMSNTWVLGATTPSNPSAGQEVSSIYYALNVAAGTQKITITFDGQLFNFQAVVSEFYNVMGVGAADGNSGNPASSVPTVTAGSIATTAAGDLVYSYAFDTNDSNSVSSFAAGSGFTLLSADVIGGSTAQYAVQTSAGAINPGVTVTGGKDPFNAVALALKAGSMGTAPAPGIRIVHVYHTLYSRPVPLQFPSTGNLLICDTAFSTTEVHLPSMSTNPANTWTDAPVPQPSYAPQIWYAANANTSPNLQITPSTSPTVSENDWKVTLVFYDVTGAASSPYDATAGIPFLQESNTNNANLLNIPVITPSTANGLVIVAMADGYGPATGMVGEGLTLDTITYGGQVDNDVMDNADGYAHAYYSTPGPVSFGWTMNSSTLPETSTAVAIAFESATQ